jgi:hypothetical protein
MSFPHGMAERDVAEVDKWRAAWLPAVLFGHPAVFALRGISGCGKSSIARELCSGRGGMSAIVSADDYFIHTDGAYHFDATKLGHAHAFCRQRLREALDQRVHTIIVDNTSCMAWELAAVEQVLIDAHAAGVTAHAFVVIEAGYDESGVAAAIGFSRNLHSVPWLSIVRQYSRFEPDARALRVPIFLGSNDRTFLLSPEAKKMMRQAIAEREKVLAEVTASLTAKLLSTREGAHKVAFSALFLSEASRDTLLAYVPVEVQKSLSPLADHVTLLHAASVAPLTIQLSAFVGTRMRLRVRGFVVGDGVVAASVDWPRAVQRALASAEEAKDALSLASGDGDGDGDDEPSAIDDSMIQTTSSFVWELLRAASVGGTAPPRHALGLNTFPHVTVATLPGVSARTSNDLLDKVNGACTSITRKLTIEACFGVAVYDRRGHAGRLNIANADEWRQWLTEKSKQ